jgi:hypothetical protein
MAFEKNGVTILAMSHFAIPPAPLPEEGGK